MRDILKASNVPHPRCWIGTSNSLLQPVRHDVDIGLPEHRLESVSSLDRHTIIVHESDIDRLGGIQSETEGVGVEIVAAMTELSLLEVIDTAVSIHHQNGTVRLRKDYWEFLGVDPWAIEVLLRKRVESHLECQQQIESNIFRNYELFEGYGKINSSDRQTSDVVVVGAGASVEYLGSLLNNLQRDCLVIAAASVIPELIRQQVAPEYIIVIDPRPYQFDSIGHFFSETTLVGFPWVDDELFRSWPGPCRMAFGQGKYGLTTGVGTVIGPCLDLAGDLSTDRLILIGCELSGPRSAEIRDFNYMAKALGSLVSSLRKKGRRVHTHAMPYWWMG